MQADSCISASMKAEKAIKLINESAYELSQLVLIASAKEAGEYVAPRTIRNAETALQAMNRASADLDTEYKREGATRQSVDPYIAKTNECQTTFATTKEKLEGLSLGSPKTPRDRLPSITSKLSAQKSHSEFAKLSSDKSTPILLDTLPSHLHPAMLSFETLPKRKMFAISCLSENWRLVGDQSAVA
jgi:hypothetical protein